MDRRAVSKARLGGITYQHPGAFWLGILAVVVGVLLHLPMFIESADMGFRMAGMSVDSTMLMGMALLMVGVAATVYGIWPRSSEAASKAVAGLKVRALDDAPINGAHIGLLLVMAAAVTIDVMKPTTFGFIMPGVAEEYGLRSPLNPDGTLPAALYPLSGIVGTVLGSFMWGWLGDRIGRRAAILLSGVLFIVTSICGTMPSFYWNLAMCFIMGVGVGGMLPIAFALLAEVIPARHRGWLMVLIGGDVAGAYIICSWLATWLIPDYGWRIMWLVGLPTGVLLIMLNRWIPESPRFLLATGREAEARAVMERYGAEIVKDEASELKLEENLSGRYSDLFRAPFTGLTFVMIVFGLGIGLVSFGFQLWIPSNLQSIGFDEESADRMLRDAALIGFPLNFLVAWAYGFWSSKKTMIILAAGTSLALLGFAVTGNDVADHRWLLYVLLVVPIWGISSVVAVLSAYSSEIYPTLLRSKGTGLAAGASKAGGVLIISLVVAAVAAPNLVGTGLIGGIPMGLAALSLAIWGVETHKRRLEEITAEEIGAELAVAPVGGGVS